MENLLKDMGKRIFDRRKQLNMTKETLAELANVTPQTISTAGRGIGASLAPMPLLIIPGCGMQTRHQQSVCVSYRPFPNHRPLPVQLKASQALRAPQPIWL